MTGLENIQRPVRVESEPSSKVEADIARSWKRNDRDRPLWPAEELTVVTVHLYGGISAFAAAGSGLHERPASARDRPLPMNLG